jgi:hypothetical protein
MTPAPHDGLPIQTEDVLRELEKDLTLGYAALLERRRRRARARHIALAVTATALAVTAAAAASIRLFGWPAPAHVKADIAAVDQGMPEDLRLRPDVERARAVAQSGDSTLFVADLKGGGHCYEIVTFGDRGRGATCRTAGDLMAQPLELTLPSDDSGLDTAPVTVGGRINLKNASRLRVRYGPAGATNQIPLGADGYFVFNVPEEHRADAHRSALFFSAANDKGVVLASATVPADWDGPAHADTEQPIFVNTRSDSNDFTKVYEISGHVNIDGAVELELSYRDGAQAKIPLQAHNDYSYVVPAGRIDDFMVPQTLSARDRLGHVLAQASVAAVAYWHGRNRP